jgi:hypothetical protein
LILKAHRPSPFVSRLKIAHLFGLFWLTQKHTYPMLNTTEPIAKVFFCGSTSSPRTEKVNDFNLSPFTLSLSKGKLRTFAITSTILN